eukprot:6166724-Pyramimonas_sp.AAC.1
MAARRAQNREAKAKQGHESPKAGWLGIAAARSRPGSRESTTEDRHEERGRALAFAAIPRQI